MHADQWAKQGLNLRPPACKAGALPLSYSPAYQAFDRQLYIWWAQLDLNQRPPACEAGATSAELCARIGSPRGIRIPVSGLKGRCPRPLDDGASVNRSLLQAPSCGHPARLSPVYRGILTRHSEACQGALDRAGTAFGFTGTEEMRGPPPRAPLVSIQRPDPDLRKYDLV